MLFERPSVICGSCGDMDAIPDGAVDLVVSGPPYYTYIDYQAAARGDEATSTFMRSLTTSELVIPVVAVFSAA